MRDDITTKVRYILGELAVTGIDMFTYEGVDSFTLTEENVNSVSNVFINDVEEDASSYSFDSTLNKVTISSVMSTNDTVRIHYAHYPKYSDTIIQNYLQSALIHISLNNYKTFEMIDDDINPEPTEAEKNLLAVVTSILMEPDNTSYRLPDITINVPRGSLPTKELVSQAIKLFKHNTHGRFGVL